MLSATASVNTLTSGQPNAISAGPPMTSPCVVERHRASEDRDDRERDGEVREAAHRAEQLLRVAERVELAGILAELRIDDGHE